MESIIVNVDIKNRVIVQAVKEGVQNYGRTTRAVMDHGSAHVSRCVVYPSRDSAAAVATLGIIATAFCGRNLRRLDARW